MEGDQKATKKERASGRVFHVEFVPRSECFNNNKPNSAEPGAAAIGFDADFLAAIIITGPPQQLPI